MKEAGSEYFSTLILNVLSKLVVGCGPVTGPAGVNAELSASQILAGTGPPAGCVNE